MEEHEDVLETDNTEADVVKRNIITSLAVPPCDIVSAGAPAVWRSLFATHSREYCVGRRGKVQGARGPQTSELWPGASLSGGIVI